MGKLIVIDKEKVERSEHSELIKTAISLLIKHGVATELSTDQSIELRALKYLKQSGIKDYPLNQSDLSDFWVYPSDLIKHGATEQDLISKARENKNGYDYNYNEKSNNKPMKNTAPPPNPPPINPQELKCECTHTQACEICANEKGIDWSIIKQANK